MDEIWKNGILTVDTNVLLDLYRYHESTRDSLLASLKGFGGKKWLSYQACSEFFRNRTKVIVSFEKTFNQANEEVNKLATSLASVISQLKGNRIIPSEIVNELENGVSTAITGAVVKIFKAKADYPRYLRDDPILEQILDLFDGSVGDDFPSEELASITAIAEDRKTNKIPPGYKDKDKDEGRPYGDYFLWRQVLDHAKSKQSPIVLVTSERKEDWWEEISGKTTGPRPELLKEAMETSGQKILIYQTDRFLEYAQQRLHQPVNEVAISEIRAISNSRFSMEGAVNLKMQQSTESSEILHTGALLLELRRPVRNFTVSGHFEPNMMAVPTVDASLRSAPDDMPQHRIRAATGTRHDFNIHVTSDDPNVRLPAGDYVIEYSAACVSGEAPEPVLES